FQGRLPAQRQRVSGPDLTRREAAQDLVCGADVASTDRPRPRREQVVLIGAELDRPEHLRVRVVGVFPDPCEEVGVVAGMPGPPAFGLPGRLEALLAALADRLQLPAR